VAVAVAVVAVVRLDSLVVLAVVVEVPGITK